MPETMRERMSEFISDRVSLSGDHSRVFLCLRPDSDRTKVPCKIVVAAIVYFISSSMVSQADTCNVGIQSIKMAVLFSEAREDGHWF